MIKKILSHKDFLFILITRYIVIKKSFNITFSLFVFNANLDKTAIYEDVK